MHVNFCEYHMYHVKAPLAVTFEICWPQNIFLFSLVFSEFYPVKGYELLLHYKTIPLWNIGQANSNFNGHFDFPPFSKTSNITKETEHTMSQLKIFSPMHEMGLLCAVSVEISMQICTDSMVFAFLWGFVWANKMSECNLYLAQYRTYSPSG